MIAPRRAGCGPPPQAAQAPYPACVAGTLLHAHLDTRRRSGLTGSLGAGVGRGRPEEGHPHWLEEARGIASAVATAASVYHAATCPGEGGAAAAASGVRWL
eukprot:2865253-Prymnesium_polylepis.1